MISRVFGRYAFVPMLLALLVGHGCKSTSNSGVQDFNVGAIQTLTLQQWTAACQQQLNDPKGGAQARSDLQALANTTDCATAYPVLQKVMASYTTAK